MGVRRVCSGNAGDDHRHHSHQGVVLPMIQGFVDPSFGINCLRGSDAWYLNQGFGRDGAANDDGHPTLLPSSSKWEFKVTYFSNLAAKGVKVARVEGHDPAAWKQVMASGWEAVAADALETLDAARLFGIKVIITLGGLSDALTWQQAEKLLDDTNPEYKAFQVLMAKVADALHGHPALKLLEALNEADFRSVIKGHWLKRFPQGRMQLLRGFAAWQVTLLDGVRELQVRKGTPIGNGTAMDGTLFTDPNGNAAMPWGTNECIYEIIPLMGAGCDVWTPHVYQNEDAPDHLLVLKRDKVPSFVRAAEVAGMELIIAEAGALWRGGTRTPALQAVFDAYPELVVCWMIRSWDPRVYSRPSVPARVPYSPAPQTPVETPAPVADPVEPSIPSDPAQEPPDEPEEPSEEEDVDTLPEEPADTQEPAEEEPSGDETGEETPEDDEPADEAPSDPPEAVEEDTSNSDKGTPSTPETGPRIGPGFVLWFVIEWIIGLFNKVRKVKK
ncbi:MAG: hypothetical protein JET69_05505 [Methanomassiliicoccales archaeon]|nr:hypothetical protein [Methanomassiliicoccales archaeon]